MNAHTEITRDMIRRFPFAVNPARITDEDEAYVAAHMADRERKAGHMRRMPTTDHNNQHARIKLDALQQSIVDLMQDGRERTIADMCRKLPESAPYDVRACVIGLVANGMLFQSVGTGRSRTAGIYCITRQEPANVSALREKGARTRQAIVSAIKAGYQTRQQIMEAIPSLTTGAYKGAIRTLIANGSIENATGYGYGGAVYVITEGKP